MGKGRGRVVGRGRASVADGAAGHGHKQTVIIVPLKTAEMISKAPGSYMGSRWQEHRRSAMPRAMQYKRGDRHHHTGDDSG